MYVIKQVLWLWVVGIPLLALLTAAALVVVAVAGAPIWLLIWWLA